LSPSALEGDNNVPFGGLFGVGAAA